jgi:putative MATE family efflux protein
MPAPLTYKAFDRTIVEGPLATAVWKIAWPTMLQNVISGLQGIVDHTMVGHFVGFTGNAAIGVSWQIFIVIIVFISSMYSGMAVLVARFAGADEPEKVNRTVYQAFLTSLVLAGFIMAPLGYYFSPQLLDIVNAAPEVKAEALPYLRTMFTFGIGLLMFFMLGGALRAAGDAKTPLRLGIMMTLLNMTFNVILIRGLGPIPAFGTTGAAMGTVLASVIAACTGMGLLFTGRCVIRFHRGMSLRPDFVIIRQLFTFGLPTGFQGIAMNLAGVFMLRFIGALANSAEAQAAYTVGYTQLFSLITWTSIGLMGATASVAGQNLGAGKPERTSRSVQVSSRIGMTVAAAVGLLFLTIPDVLLGIFGMDDPVVLQLGRQLLGYLAVSGLFLTVALTYTGGLQGTGDTKSPMYISLVSNMLLPVGLCYYWQATRGLQPADIWFAIVLGHFMRSTLSFLRFRQEKWRDIAVDIEPARA